MCRLASCAHCTSRKRQLRQLNGAASACVALRRLHLAVCKASQQLARASNQATNTAAGFSLAPQLLARVQRAALQPQSPARRQAQLRRCCQAQHCSLQLRLAAGAGCHAFCALPQQVACRAQQHRATARSGGVQRRVECGREAELGCQGLTVWREHCCAQVIKVVGCCLSLLILLLQCLCQQPILCLPRSLCCHLSLQLVSQLRILEGLQLGSQVLHL